MMTEPAFQLLWARSSATHRSGGVVGLVERVPGQLLRPVRKDDIATALGWLQAACECGWRSQSFPAAQPAEWNGSLRVCQADENAVHQLWLAHVQEPKR